MCPFLVRGMHLRMVQDGPKGRSQLQDLAGAHGRGPWRCLDGLTDRCRDGLQVLAVDLSFTPAMPLPQPSFQCTTQRNPVHTWLPLRCRCARSVISVKAGERCGSATSCSSRTPADGAGRVRPRADSPAAAAGSSPSGQHHLIPGHRHQGLQHSPSGQQACRWTDADQRRSQPG